jgi:hypothetical protein
MSDRPLAVKLTAREARDFAIRLRNGPDHWAGFASRRRVDAPTDRPLATATVEPNAPLLIRIVRSPYALAAARPERERSVPVRERNRRVLRELSVSTASAARSLVRPRATRAAIERLVSRPRPFRRQGSP